MLIEFPVFRTKNRPRMRDMAERPQAFIRKTLIVAALFFGSKPDAPQIVTGAIGWNAQAVLIIHGIAIGTSRAVCHPRAVASQQNGLKGSYESAGGHYHFDLAFIVVHVEVGLAIG